MSTRSMIGLKTANGVDYIRCHWDGYPSNNGVMLITHYSNKKKLIELLDLGSISSLRQYVNPPSNLRHSFDSPLEDVTVAYSRDRGENIRKKTHAKDLNTYLEDLKNSDCDYAYYYDSDEKKWYYSDCRYKFKELTLETKD